MKFPYFDLETAVEWAFRGHSLRSVRQLSHELVRVHLGERSCRLSLSSLVGLPHDADAEILMKDRIAGAVPQLPCRRHLNFI